MRPMQLRLQFVSKLFRNGRLPADQLLNRSLSSGRFLPSTLLLAAVTGCSALPVTNSPAYASEHDATQQRLSVSDQSQLMYEIMIAELAGRRGYLDIATEGYRAASERTTDPRVAERATRLAIYSRNWPHALESADRWKSLDASNVEVFEILSQIHLRRGNAEGAAVEMANLIDLSTAPVDATMDSLYLLLAQEPDRKTALAAMSQLRDKLPEEESTNIALARLAVSHAERQTALQAVDQALELNPDNKEALIVRAQVLMSLGRGDEGLTPLREAIEKEPDDVDLRLGFARLLVESERYDEAEGEMEAIFAAASDDAQALFTIGLLGIESRRYTLAQKYFESLVETGEYQSEAHYYLARIADNRQEYVEAISHYEQVTEGDSVLDAQIRSAELYGTIGEVEKGRERIQALKTTTGEQVLPRLIRSESRILRDAGEDAESLNVLSAGVEQFPEDSNLRYTRALVAEGQGQTELFKKDLEKLIADDPENAHALNALGYHYADANTNLDEAQDMLERANTLLPDDPAILDSLGWLYYRQGKVDQALEYLRAAYSQLGDPEIAAHLGEVLWVAGEQESAKDIWDKALAESPDDRKLKSVVERFVQ